MMVPKMTKKNMYKSPVPELSGKPRNSIGLSKKEDVTYVDFRKVDHVISGEVSRLREGVKGSSFLRS